MSEAERSVWEWDRYWRSRRIAACMETAAGGYAEAIASHWRAFAAGLSEGARVLDVGAGNGAAGLEIARSHSSARIDGVDLAEIEQEAALARAPEIAGRFTLHSRTDMTALPFADESFDAAVSQFAIEYADMAKAVAEIGRVLKPDGRFRVIVHAREGAPAKGAAEASADAAFLLAENGICALCERALRAAHEAATVKRADNAPSRLLAARNAADAFEAGLSAARARAAERAHDDMISKVCDVLEDLFSARNQGPAPALEETLAQARAEASAHKMRVDALSAAALSEADAAAAFSACRDFTFEAPAPVRDGDGALLGWEIDAVRNVAD